MMNIQNEKGFTLIEVVIALGVLAIGIIAMFSMQTMGIKGNTSANRVTESTTWGADKVEEIVSLGYGDLVDRNSNGTKKDLDKNGVDNSGGNFGLDDVGIGPNDADDVVVVNNTAGIPMYSVCWNVAVDHPIRGVKTVQINVMHVATNKIVSMRYQKFDQI